MASPEVLAVSQGDKSSLSEIDGLTEPGSCMHALDEVVDDIAEGDEESVYGVAAFDLDSEERSEVDYKVMASVLHPGVVLRWAPCERFPNKAYAHVKRAADFVAALVALVVFSPLLVICALSVRVTSSGPVLFRQERWGRSCSSFKCYKFRTMLEETPSDVPAQAFSNKDRFMTPVGSFLRKWSLDELPQLINILKGDMSVIGPRPVIIREKGLIDRRGPLNGNDVRPGLTGWAQINGRNLVNDDEKAFLDGEYVANMSLLFDVSILFKTVAVVVGRRGIDRKAQQDADGVPF